MICLNAAMADGRRNFRRARRVKATAVAIVTCTAVMSMGMPAHAATGGLGGLLTGLTGAVGSTLANTTDAVVSVVHALSGILTAGWDDGATSPPTRLALVADAINADEMWSRGVDGSDIGVAVIDSGVAPVPGLDGTGKLINGPDLSFDSQYDNARYLDAYGHGTHMASIIAGNDGTTTGFRGVAPGAHIVNMRVGATDGAVDVSQVIAAIDWTVQHRNDPGLNIRVISLSYGTDSVQSYQRDPLTAAVESAWRNGIVVVVSGGNDGTAHSSLTDPATDPFVLAVGADDVAGTAGVVDDGVAVFSSRGSATRGVDLVAPGVSIAGLRDPGSTIDDQHPGAVVDGRLFRGSGTSQAAAVTAGAVALLLDARPNLTPDMVKALLRSTASRLVGATAREQGAGLINVSAASTAVVLPTYRQSWPIAAGSGSLETARGGQHVADEGVELNGEVDIMGQPWNGARWIVQSALGSAWSGGTWNGSVWAGSRWDGANWTGAAWTGKSWSGKSWSGQSWSGKSWSGKSWSGQSWSGKSWSGKSWSGSNWKST
jgi:serine protease AprX